jgi:hypothetical protein
MLESSQQQQQQQTTWSSAQMQMNKTPTSCLMGSSVLWQWLLGRQQQCSTSTCNCHSHGLHTGSSCCGGSRDSDGCSCIYWLLGCRGCK